MTITIHIISLRTQELAERYGPGATPVIARQLADTSQYRYALAAELHSGTTVSLLDWQTSDEPLVQGCPEPYDTWHNKQATVDFWAAAFSWSVYWNALVSGFTTPLHWPVYLERPLPCKPHLGFLELSFGFIAWDFQLELMYRLADPDLAAAIAFRKAWMAGRLEAENQASNLMMPDGETLLDAIKGHGPPTDWKWVSFVPISVAVRLLKV